MTRTILAIVTAFLAVTTVFASAAEACISCEHVPVVARSSSTSHSVKRYKKRRFHARSIAAARAKAKARAIAAAKAKARARAVAAARAKAKAKAIAAAEAAAAEEVELAETEVDEPEKVAAVSEDLGCKKFFPTVGMTLTVACVETGAVPKDEPRAVPRDEPMTVAVGCRKYFPTVGQTLTVPCE
jgi:hypothetical protein